MPWPVKILPHYTYSDYCNWKGRWELIEGIPFAMTPTPMPKNQLVCANILAHIAAFWAFFGFFSTFFSFFSASYS
jgi:hypothetical protein